MKTVMRTASVFALGVLLCGGVSRAAETHSNTNLPGTSSGFSFVVDSTTTNFSLLLPGNFNAYSHLLLRHETPPTDTTYDFASQLIRQTNSIHLELPEAAAGTWYVRVRTPAGSQTHAYTVTIERNSPDLRSTNRPAMKPLGSVTAGLATAGRRMHFRVDLATNTAWEVRLNGANAAPDVYVQRGAIASETSFLRASTGLTNDYISFSPTEGTANSYGVALITPAGSPTSAFNLQIAPLQPTPLQWDLGLTHEGASVYTNYTGRGGAYYFKITTATSPAGGWRTALRVLSGEASVYLRRGDWPSQLAYDFKSDQKGSDGFVVASSQYSPNEEWYILVLANELAVWSLVSGSPYIMDLGSVAADGSSNRQNLEIGPEGMRYFSVTALTNMLAWQVWLKSTNYLTNIIYLKKTSLPFTYQNAFELSQRAQMLVVPPYLASGQQYFIAVSGRAEDHIDFQCQPQPVTPLPYNSSFTTNFTDFGYLTFAVTVPSNQVAWQLSTPALRGNPNFAVRRDLVPNEINNDAYSELSSNITDNISLVTPPPGAPGLSDGPFFITVYTTNATTQFTFNNAPAVITDIDYTGDIVNDDPGRVGWRYYKVSNLEQQNGTLGWDLSLTNHTPGTRLALRRTAAPSLWPYRAAIVGDAKYYDVLSTAEYLQIPGHQADIWYIGVYNPSNALGSFRLVRREIQTINLSNNTPLTRTNVPGGRWEYFKIDVANQPGAVVGWDLRLVNVTAGSPQLVVARGLLPIDTRTTISSGGTSWPEGGHWAPRADWTGRVLSADGTNEEGRVLTMTMGRPLVPGSYYVGVFNRSNTLANYTLLSRWIGPGQAIPVETISFDGARITNSLPAREAAYYEVVLPTGLPTWKVRLTPQNGGEAMMIISSNALPNIETTIKRLQKPGNEHFLRAPALNASQITGGTNYIAVISEGNAPPSSQQVGAGVATFFLETLGPDEPIYLGTLSTNLTFTDPLLDSGEVRVFQFHSAPSSKGFWMTLKDKSGNPWMVGTADQIYPDPNLLAPDPYGTEGGRTQGPNASAMVLHALGNFPFVTVTVNARKQGAQFVNASYTLEIENIEPEPLTFDGGSATVAGASGMKGKFYYIDVPPEAKGWDLRLDPPLSAYPRMYVRRGDFLPHVDVPDGNLASRTTWPVYSQWVVGDDYTGRWLTPEGDSDWHRILVTGMDRPLEPGRYCVGVYASELDPTTQTMSFVLQSRGIGSGMQLPITSLAYDMGTATGQLAPREVHYFQVNIPAGAPSWRLRLLAEAGETMMVVLKGAIPNSEANYFWYNPSATATNSPGYPVQKDGNEEFLLLPEPGQSTLVAGDYYVAVTGEGVSPSSMTRIGVGQSTYTLGSLGPAAVQQLGTIGLTETVVQGTLDAGQTAIYQFQVLPTAQSFAAQLRDISGMPVMVLRSGPNAPDPSVASPMNNILADDYGSDGGQTLSNFVHQTLITVPNPEPVPYTLTIKARGKLPATYSLRLSASGAVVVDCNGGRSSITNQAAGEWRFFRVQVPESIFGWDVRLESVLTGSPRMVVSRDSLPTSLMTTAGWQPQNGTNWPVGYQWAPAEDWTRRKWSNNDLDDESGRILAVGMGRPLQAGTYYIGVYAAPNTTQPMTYSLRSRAIGPGLSINLEDLAFGSALTNLALAPREAAYYRIVVPSNTPSWQVRLQNLSGESMLAVMRHAVPNIASVMANGTTASGKGMQQPGNEHFVLLPSGTATQIPPGTNFLAVISEGVNPGPLAVGKPHIGTGASGFVLENLGPVVVTNLGLLTSRDLAVVGDIEGGQVAAYQFTVPPGLIGFEARLENLSGYPVAVLIHGDRLPDPGVALSPIVLDSYGNEGGVPSPNVHPTLITLPNPSPGVYSLVVKARQSGTTAPRSTYTLRLTETLVPLLNFSASENGNGLDHTATDVLENNERAFFRFLIPDQLNGEPVIGWKLDLARLSGASWLRVRRGLLPSDADRAVLMPFAPASAIIAPPFLEPGEWFVEIIGSNSPAAFTLSSSMLQLERPAWQMPLPDTASALPGQPGHVFGTTTIDPYGVPLPGDQGINLNLGMLHYYAVDVPDTNRGLLRIQLDALGGGNPNLYMRVAAIPTLYHSTNGAAGSIYDRAMLMSTNTEYANWVPLDGKRECQLKPGRYYLAVHAAGNSNTRYRLYTSVGQVSEMPVHGPMQTNQHVLGGDWVYYRLPVPSLVPFNFNLTFSKDQPGDFQVYLRDDVPPGNGIIGTDFRDWASDAKNTLTNRSYTAEGTYTITMPPLRPGHIYYVGVRALRDSVLSIGATTNGLVGRAVEIIPFYGGGVQLTLPALSEVLYRIDVPLDATRWKHSATHQNSVVLYMEQGTVPTKSTSDDYRSTAANWNLNMPLVVWNTALRQYDPAPWPAVAGHSFYLLVTNSSNLPQDFIFLMDGCSYVTEDEDRDRLPDIWERFYFGSLSQSEVSDFDRDGVRNLEEQADGTDPTNPFDFYCRLTVTPINGVVYADQVRERYQIGQEVVLTPVPLDGYTFVSWGGDASGSANPLRIVMDGAKTISALFKLNGDNFDTPLWITGEQATINAMNVSMTKEPGEPFHSGNPGGKSMWWRWVAPRSGAVTLSTAGSWFNTLLAVYTGTNVAQLTLVANDFTSGTNSSRVTFQATAGTTYNIAVDGHDAASSLIQLSLALDGGGPILPDLRLGLPVRIGGALQMGVSGPASRACTIYYSTNLNQWYFLQNVTTDANGAATISDPAQNLGPVRFYRAQLQ